jgi:hypothetical protein
MSVNVSKCNRWEGRVNELGDNERGVPYTCETWKPAGCFGLLVEQD